MSNTLKRYDQVIGGATDLSTNIRHVPDDGRTETTVGTELNRLSNEEGDTDISSIGDGTTTGAISQLSSDLSELSSNLGGKIIVTAESITTNSYGYTSITSYTSKYYPLSANNGNYAIIASGVGNACSVQVFTLNNSSYIPAANVTISAIFVWFVSN